MKATFSTEMQEKAFKSLLSRPENKNCADCNAKNPSWASLEFGVFICYNCSGFHREMGPTVTRVKSLSLDKWEIDWIELMSQIGNSKSNEFWECRVPSYFVKPKSDNEMRKFIREKYLNKMFTPRNHKKDPVAAFWYSKQRKELPEFKIEEIIANGADPVLKPKSPPIKEPSNLVKWDNNNTGFMNPLGFATHQPKKNNDSEAFPNWVNFDNITNKIDNKKTENKPVIAPQKVVSTDWTGKIIEDDENKNKKNDNNWMNFPNSKKNNNNNAKNLDERQFKTVAANNRKDFFDFGSPKNEPNSSNNNNKTNTFKGKVNNIEVKNTVKNEVNLLDLSPNDNFNLLSPNIECPKSAAHQRPSSVDVYDHHKSKQENNNDNNNNSGNLHKPIENKNFTHQNNHMPTIIHKPMIYQNPNHNNNIMNMQNPSQNKNFGNNHHNSNLNHMMTNQNNVNNQINNNYMNFNTNNINNINNIGFQQVNNNLQNVGSPVNNQMNNANNTNNFYNMNYMNNMTGQMQMPGYQQNNFQLNQFFTYQNQNILNNNYSNQNNNLNRMQNQNNNALNSDKILAMYNLNK